MLSAYVNSVQASPIHFWPGNSKRDARSATPPAWTRGVSPVLWVLVRQVREMGGDWLPNVRPDWSPHVNKRQRLVSCASERSRRGAVAGLVGIEGGVVSGVINLESSGVEAPDWRPRHDKQYHEA